jgi:transcriptional regulator
MYVPGHFALADRNALISFIEAHPFGILVSADGGKPVATHLPFVVLDAGEPLKLGLHVAKANPHWRFVHEAEVLAIFHGAHDFVSASWYAQPQESVPTWNYSAVHCSGSAALADAAGTDMILETMVRRFEGPGRWSMENADDEYIRRMKGGIVAIEITVASIEGKLKFSQNRSEEDRERVLEHLDRTAPALARDMRSYYG